MNEQQLLSSYSNQMGGGFNAVSTGSCTFGGYHTLGCTCHCHSPVYVMSGDKTAKAIEIYKKLRELAVVDVNTVPDFMQVIDEIVKIL